MCDSFQEREFNLGGLCSGKIVFEGNGGVIIQGTIKQNKESQTQTTLFDRAIFWAANPADYMTNYSGSGLPFPNDAVAYENTPNKGVVNVVDNKFSFRLFFPNAYYAGLGTVYQKPHVNIQFNSQARMGPVMRIDLGQGIAFRSLTYPGERRNPFFYNGRFTLPIRTSEGVLRDSAYPCKNAMPLNFWGLRPPSA
jgi:hypothetical protein